MSTAQSELIQFVQIHDVIPCDFNQDGIVDLIALNHRVSTGYGFAGIGNGLFDAGPSFDLPFRPAAAACVGDPLENNLVLVSVEGSITLFHPLISSAPPTFILKAPLQVLALGGDEFSDTIAVVSDDTDTAEAYRLRAGELTMLGEYAVAPADDLDTWCEEILGWTSDKPSIPVPPAELRRRVRIADLNCDDVPDAVTLGRYEIVYHLSKDGLPLQHSAHVELGIDPLALRLADVDGNGLTDVIVLSGSGSVEVVLFETSSRR